MNLFRISHFDLYYLYSNSILPDVDIVDSFLCEKYCQRYYRCNQMAVVNDYWKVLDDEDVEELAGRYTGI